jgi:hypothetical protein
VSRVRENRMHGSMGGSWKRSTPATDMEKNTRRGNQPGFSGSVTYSQELPPRQLPTYTRLPVRGLITNTGSKQALTERCRYVAFC